MLETQWRADVRFADHVGESRLGLRQEAVGDGRTGVFRQIDEVPDQIAPGGFALDDARR